MRKRTLLLLVSLVLAMAISLGGTLAYLTDTDETVNVMTLGNVDIEQLENGKEENGFAHGAALYPAYYEDAIDWANTPGVLNKEVTVKNTGSSNAYVRTWFAFEAGNLSAADFEKYILLNRNESAASPWDWQWDLTQTYAIQDSAGNTANYYIALATLKEALKPGDTTAASLYDVAMSKEATGAQVTPMGNEYTVLVLSQAMQTVNFETMAPAKALDIGFDTAGANGVDFAKHPWVDGVKMNDAFIVPGTTIWMVKGDIPEDGGTIFLNSADDFRYLPTLLKDWASITGTTGHDHYYYQQAWKIELNSDVDLNNEPWTPFFIGEFAGFDGNNHTISNLKIASDEHWVGLFSSSLNNDSSKCPISNLVIDGADISSTYTGDKLPALGVLIGHSANPISNVTVKNAKVNGLKYAGGIVGKAQSSLTNCAVYDSEIISSGYEVGGIAGFMDIGESTQEAITVSASNCTVQNTTVQGTKEVGGIVGRAYARNNTTIKISGYNLSNVKVTATENKLFGDVVGNKYDNSNVIVEGEIEVDYTIPGTTIWLVKADRAQDGGRVLLNSADDFRYLQQLNDNWFTITNSQGHDHYYYQSAWVVELNSDVDLNNEPWTPVAINEFGGFDGKNHTVSNLKINSSADRVGLFSSTLNNDSGKCPISNLVINGANITSTDDDNSALVGVLAGYATTPISNVTVKNAKVNGVKYTGGIVGKNQSSLTNCAVYDSEILSTGKEVGGITGFMDIGEKTQETYTVSISNCTVKNATVQGTEEVGGIVGRAYARNNTTIEVNNSTLENVTVTATNNKMYDDVVGRNYNDDCANPVLVNGTLVTAQ